MYGLLLRFFSAPVAGVLMVFWYLLLLGLVGLYWHAAPAEFRYANI